MTSDDVAMTPEWRSVFIERRGVILSESEWYKAPDKDKDFLFEMCDIQALQELGFLDEDQADVARGVVIYLYSDERKG